jgi:dienelactone hydrolase
MYHMKTTARFVLILWTCCLPAQYKPPDDIRHRRVDIVSEGVRMSGEVFALQENAAANKKLPCLVMSHGWGGTASLLRPEAVAFARAGYFALAFDYRGWGESDSRVILTGPPPKEKKDGRFTAEVLEVRGVVDPIDMTTDILNALHWMQAEPWCDTNRIGVWGSSYSGAHVVYVAARDPRVKALVSQVAPMDSRPRTETDRKLAYEESTKRARGEIGYPPPFAMMDVLAPDGSRAGQLRGHPIRSKHLVYSPIEDVERAAQCATLFIVAEKEELFDNRDHALQAYQRAKGPKKLVTVPGITHYGIYREAREQAQKLAIAWFDEHLKK